MSHACSRNHQVRSAVVAGLAAAALLAAGCSAPTPRVSATPDRSLFGASELSFIREGETTREQILLKLGNPASRFEGDRVLVYQVGFESDGRVHLYAPRLLTFSHLQDWQPGSYSLVLAFRDDGVLRAYSLVGTE